MNHDFPDELDMRREEVLALRKENEQLRQAVAELQQQLEGWELSEKALPKPPQAPDFHNFDRSPGPNVR